ncbi:hypothetical protein LINPERHAP1_LOCUS12286 [Linum perenne]
MTINRNSSSSDGISCSSVLREKLNMLFDMSVKSLYQTKSLDEAVNVAVEILALTTDPLHQTVLKDLLSRLADFKETIPSCLYTIETSSDLKSSNAGMIRDLEERLVHRKKQLTSLEAEASRLKEESSKLDVEIQQLTSRKAKILEHMNSTGVELEKANEEASKELDELKKEHRKRKEAGMRAMERRWLRLMQVRSFSRT